MGLNQPDVLAQMFEREREKQKKKQEGEIRGHLQ